MLIETQKLKKSNADIEVQMQKTEVDLKKNQTELEKYKSEYEKLINREIKYRKDLVKALDESSRREGVLREELNDLKGEIDALTAGLETRSRATRSDRL